MSSTHRTKASSTKKGSETKPKAKRPDASAIRDEIAKIRSELVRTGWENTLKITSPKVMYHLGICKRYDYNVQKLGSKIIKWSERTRSTEALSMEFVRRNTNIPVPRVLDILQKDGETHIVMEFVQGKMLSDVWSDLTSNQKSEIVGKLKEYWTELRALEPPHPGRVEAVDGTACFDSRIGDNMGPFDSVRAFQTRLGYDHIRNSAEEYPSFRDAFSRVKGKSYRTVFTHGDFCLHNILVHNKTNQIVAIIDWEFAGWYPEYWEYTQGIFANFKYREFKEMLKGGYIVKQYPDELEAENNIVSVFNRV